MSKVATKGGMLPMICINFTTAYRKPENKNYADACYVSSRFLVFGMEYSHANGNNL